jgi:hypothetical protein
MVRSQNAVTLPRDLGDLLRYYDIGGLENSRPTWQSTYYKKEGATATRRHDALYSEAFTLPYNPSDKDTSTNKHAERLESLIKVLTQLRGDLFNFIRPLC